MGRSPLPLPRKPVSRPARVTAETVLLGLHALKGPCRLGGGTSGIS